MSKDQFSKEDVKRMHSLISLGNDAKMIKENRAFNEILEVWEGLAKDDMMSAAAFDNEKRIRAKITIENIEFLKNYVESTIIQGYNAGLELAGEDMTEVGIL